MEKTQNTSKNNKKIVKKQKYNKNSLKKEKYFEFYDDIKHGSHNVVDW